MLRHVDLVSLMSPLTRIQEKEAAMTSQLSSVNLKDQAKIKVIGVGDGPRRG